MFKKEEKIFVTDNPLTQSSLKSEVLKAFERCAKLETLVKDFGLPLTRDIVKDCLTLRKETRNVQVEGTAKWVGESSEAKHFPREFKPVEIWRNNEHLQIAFNTMLKEAEAQGGRVADIKQRKDELQSEFDILLDDIYNVFHINRQTIETGSLLKYFDIENNSIVLIADFDERLKEDTATYATTTEAKDACILHREIAEKLDALAALMKNVPRYEFASELNKLFYLTEDGKIQATPIDYDLFT